MQSNVSGGPEKTSLLSIYITGVPRSQETGPPENPTVGQGLGPCSGPRGGALSYERGTPVQGASGRDPLEQRYQVVTRS